MKQYATTLLLYLVLYVPNALGTPPDGLHIEVLGLSKDRAFMSVNGRQHVFQSVGSAKDGIHLVSANAHEAVIDYGGQTLTLGLSGRIGGSLSARPSGEDTHRPSVPSKVTITRDPGGRFVVEGRINGQQRPLLVDTGASMVAMSSRDAAALGIDMVGARKRIGQTASGAMSYYEVMLDEIDIDGIRVANVQAAVLEGNYPNHILLGMSFLKHVAIHQQGTELSMTPQS